MAWVLRDDPNDVHVLAAELGEYDRSLAIYRRNTALWVANIETLEVAAVLPVPDTVSGAVETVIAGSDKSSSTVSTDRFVRLLRLVSEDFD